MHSAATQPTAPPASYEAAMHELDSLVSKLEAGQLSLDELLSQYRRGAELLAYCRTQLEAVEQQIQVVETAHAASWADEA